MIDQAFAPPSAFGALRSLALLAALFLALMVAGVVLAPPPARSAVSEGEFNATGARDRLARMLGDEAPHPVDSEAQEAVRASLLGEIEALGFTPELRDDFVCRPQPRGPLVDCARVRNIVFSVGPAGGPSVLAATHYDSVPAAPGASDAGVGIATWLEVARILSHEQLTRRVIFLISDGEEPALLGAYAFAHGDPLMASVQALINLEARGTRGPAIFFESNQPNMEAVAAFSAAPRPVANSVAADVYALMSNSSDVTALRRPGLDVLNIALLDGLEDYHTPQDSLASFNVASLQHMGDTALWVTRRLAGAPDWNGQTPMIYTDIASRVFVSAPVWAGQAVLAFCVIVAFAAFWRVGPEGRWRTFAAPLVALVFAGVLSAAAGIALGALRPGEAYAFAYPEPTRAWCFLFALLGPVLALLVLRASRTWELACAAGMFWFAALGGMASIFVNGIAIMFAMPALVYAMGWIISLAWKRAHAIAAVLAALLALVVWAPVLYLVELALGFDMPFAITLLAAILALTWAGVLVCAQAGVRWRGVAFALGAAAAASLVLAMIAPSATEARPRPLNISYFLNTSDGQARILAGAATRALPADLRDDFTAETILPGDRFDTWAAPAPVEPIDAPALEGVSVTQAGGERVVRARLAMHGAYRATIRMPLSAQPLRATVNGADANFAETGPGLDTMNLACQGRACEGAEVVIILNAEGERGDWHMIGQFPGRSVAWAQAVRARRPARYTPIQFGDGVVTLSRVSLE